MVMEQGIDIEALSVPELEHMLTVFNNAIEHYEQKCGDCQPPLTLVMQRDNIETVLGAKKS